MRAGKLRHRVIIQKATETRDAHGGITRTWADVSTVWASVEPLSGREFLDASQTEADISHRVRIRHYDDLTPSHRIVHGGRHLNIETIMNRDERDIELELMCKEDV